MNRFRTKKRAKEATEGPVRASTESENPSPPSIKPSKTFRLGKKAQQPEAKLELDLTNALPPSDDFRTSLLMSGLSARFSMLREQDDPLSKIGKASDDSVLFPPTKRQSRLNDLAFQPHGLSDIAEVSSINGSARPWAVARTDSYKTVESNGTDEDSVHSGGIMSRAKPGEGNILFGGRQKIYKIPVGGAGSTKSLTDGAGSGGMGGRAMYESDISQSTFQKLRDVEKAQQQEEERDEEDHYVRSPSPTYNRNRETSSTTSSAGPSTTRISTAATSVTSQRAPSVAGSTTPISPTGATAPGAERPVNKGRRLYETGLDQHLHEQQFSAMSRIDNLTRQRALGAQTPPLGRNSPTLASHPAERWHGNQITGKASMPNMRTASPSPVPGMGPFDFPSRQHTQESKIGFGMPPLSPPVSENDDHLVLALQPNDRGKATALGAFAKPAQPYDENKYSQRQIQMQQGRETPPLRKTSPPRAFAPRQPQMGRTRADSNATYSSARSRSNSSAQRHFLPPDRIPENGLKSMASVPSDSSASSARASSNGDLPGQPAEQGEQSRPNLQHIRDLANLYRQNQNLPLERPPESQHPANRQHHALSQDSSPASEQSQTTAKESPSTPEAAPTPSVTVSTASNVPADSPTLGPTTEMTGLSGMVRQHLRSDSNASSVYGGMPTSAFNSHEDEPVPQNEYTLGKHPAAGDDWDHSDDAEIKSSLDFSINSSKNDDALPPPLSMRSVSGETTGTQERSSWEKELTTHHTRDGSTETQKEREDFRNDLAARRRRVQENLKSFVETESRSSSPLPGAELLRDVGHKANPLGLLKSKTSRGSLMGKPKDFRTAKAPANGPSFSRSTSPARATIGEDPWREEDEQVLQDGPKIVPGQSPNKAYLQARRDAQRDRERLVAIRHQQQPRTTPGPIGSERMNGSVEDLHYRPGHRDASRDRGQLNMRPRHQTPSRERKPPPVAYAHRNGNHRESQGSVDTNHSTSRPGSRQSRDRSGSDASQRSKSRNGGRHPDVAARPAIEGAPSPNMSTLDKFDPQPPRHLPPSPHVNGLPSQASSTPSPLMGSEPRMESRSRSRSNSRSTPGFFDQHRLPPLQTSEIKDPALSPRPPITSPMSGSSTPNLPQPSPMNSVANTPTTPGFQSQGTVPAHRKRSINKSDISEPRFVSSTSRVTTVNLPPGASLQNGIDAPPIPPVNPRRKARPVFGFGRKEDQSDYPVQPATFSPTEDRTTFSDDGESKHKPQRQKLRKISSEGGNLNAKARQAIFTQPSPAMPEPSPIMANTPVESVEGGMF